MARNRLPTAKLVGLAAAALLLCPPGLAAGRYGGVRGTVSDPGGYRIPAAEVRIQGAPGADQLLAATTNRSGEFFLAGLPAGLYLLTASKEGYASASASLNTLIESSIALTLPPLLGELRPDGQAVAAPAGRAWALRLPRRDLLREQGAQADAADTAREAGLLQDSDNDVEARPAGGDSTDFPEDVRLDGELRQMFAVGGHRGAAGRASRVELGADLGRDVRLTLSGETDRSTLEPAGSGDAAETDHLKSLARLGARFEPRPADRVEVSAVLGRETYSALFGAGGTGGGYDQELQGYGARWERDLGVLGAMDVALDYRSVEVTPGLVGPQSGEAASSAAFAAADNQLWQASGSYRLGISDRRQMTVGVRARRLQVQSPEGLATSTFETGAGLPATEGEQWAFDLSGREQMELSKLMSLDYGFNYHRRGEEVFSPDAADAFIPEAGLTLSQQDGTRWSAGISLALDRPEARAEEQELQAPGADDGLLSRLGYRLGMDHPFHRHGLSLALNATYHPYAYTPIHEGVAPLEIDSALRRSLMLSEGNAESLEVGLRVEKRFRKLVAAVGSQLGQVEGYMITGYFDEMPVQQVSYKLVRYMVASARGYSPASGTLVHVDYQRYLNNPGQAFDFGSLPYQYERIDMALEQDLPFVNLWNAHWRVLVALQTAHTDALGDADLEPLRAAGVRQSESRLSGGVAIRF